VLRCAVGHPAVSSAVMGTGTTDEMRRNPAATAVEFPAALWSDLRGEGLLAADGPVPE
jgi:D-threo-aldose 1-dehydrogenase